MSSWENSGKSDEWYTPAYVFDALGECFDLDVAAPSGGAPHVPSEQWFCSLGLDLDWHGFVWMNPPFGGRNAIAPWMDKFIAHGNGIALTPDRTSAPWWQDAAERADAILFTRGKIKFERPDGTIGGSPGSGVTLWAAGGSAVEVLLRAQAAGLGTAWRKA